MQLRTASLLALAASLTLSACGVPPTTLATAIPAFVTATLPPSATAQPTSTPLPPTLVPTPLPVEGTTTSQLNVRAEPSTAAQTLGTLDPFATVQIIAKDAGGSWYQILFPAAEDGKGWITARYVQVPQGQEIPPLAGAPGAQSGPSGVVTQQVNVRGGPGTGFQALGTLNPQDTVTLTAKNADGTWLQVAYSSAPDGLGWIAAGYVQSTEIAGLPIINEQGQMLGTGTLELAPAAPTPTLLPAMVDGDSASNPGASMAFSPSGAGSLQFSSDVSIPEGDAEDWVAFVPYSAPVSIRLECLGSPDIVAELSAGTSPLAGMPPITCGEQRTLALAAGDRYLLHVFFPVPASGLQYTRFILFINSLR